MGGARGGGLTPSRRPLAGPVAGGESLEDDHVVVDAGGEEVGGVGAGEAGEDGAGAGQLEGLECVPSLGVGAVDHQLAVEP